MTMATAISNNDRPCKTIVNTVLKDRFRQVLVLVGLLLTLNSYAQAPLVSYKPVIIPRSTTQPATTIPTTPDYYPQQSAPARPSYTTIGAYYIDNSTGSFKRTKIKINPTQNYFGETVLYVRGVLNRSSYSESWHDSNTTATKVSKNFDSDVIVNNFEYKADVYLPGIKTVYFNY